MPLLGHALAYRRDPAAFVTAQCRAVGACFQLDLAGKRMVVVGPDREATRRVASAPESVLSARQAVLDIGFAETLGRLNVQVGTDLHKRIVKQAFGASGGKRLADELGGGMGSEVPLMHAALGRAIRARLGPPADGERGRWVVVDDLLALVRFAVLRASVERLLGPAVLEAAGDGFCDAFMRFQDAVEDATAKAAVLPRWLALPLVLWPTARMRAGVRSMLAAAIARAVASHASHASPASGGPGGGIGPWVRALVVDDGRTAADAAELCCGLLFAAHKNPAIGAAQAVLMSLGGPPDALEAVRAEAAALRDEPTEARLAQCDALRRASLEALRLCAHTIGAVRTVVDRAGYELTLGADDAGRAPPSYLVPCGATIALAHVPTHRDCSIWGAGVERFDPGRPEWSSPSAPDDLKFTTFSQGLHRCPGERLALLVMRCALGQLLCGGFETELLAAHPVPPLDFERATLAQRAGKVRVRVRERL